MSYLIWLPYFDILHVLSSRIGQQGSDIVIFLVQKQNILPNYGSNNFDYKEWFEERP